MNAPDYDIIASVQGSMGQPARTLGAKGNCRYCGTDDPRLFRNLSHSVPEALGNKWISSADECDGCNRLFAVYDDALAKAVGPVLTLGGTQGKGNKVRQTGRTDGPSVIRHGHVDGRRQLSLEVRDQSIAASVALDPANGIIRFTTPVPTERLVPRHAFKAIAKAAVAIMPAEELPRFSWLRTWLFDRDDRAAMAPLYVGVSFGSVGNAPPLIAAALLRRRPGASGPKTVFVLSIGSVCLQIATMEDGIGDTWPVGESARCGVRWSNTLKGADGDLVIDYGVPAVLDWSSAELEPQPLESIVTHFNVRTTEGRIRPVFFATRAIDPAARRAPPPTARRTVGRDPLVPPPHLP